MYSVYTITPVYVDGTRGETKTVVYPPPNSNEYKLSWTDQNLTVTWDGDYPYWKISPGGAGVGSTPTSHTSSTPGTQVFAITGNGTANVRIDDGSRVRTNHYLPTLVAGSSGSTDNTLRIVNRDTADEIGIEPTGGVAPYRIETGFTGDFERFIPQYGFVRWYRDFEGTFTAKVTDAVGTQVVRTYTI
jgi:hypothetical protein